MASPWPIFIFSFLSLSLLPRVYAQYIRISPVHEPSVWEVASRMHLQLTAPDSEALQLTYNVYPLTEHAGLNQTDRSVRPLQSIWIRGNLVAAGYFGNGERLPSPENFAFLSCDGEDATREATQLLGARTPAMLLYSLRGNACGLEGGDLSDGSIYTMGDSAEARDVINHTIRVGGVLRATITGSSNMTSTLPGNREQGGTDSAVAMSILYSITGLITLLFLAIIAMGAIRAHRYPERYGPRLGLGGRPSQSRARGLARAVLETLPIVKFGDPNPAKPDPSLELESQASGTGPDPTVGTRLSAIPEEPRTPQVRGTQAAPMSGAVPEDGVPPTGPQNSSPEMASEDHFKMTTTTDGRPSEEHVGCSICTEDFTVGEDVRVLPCDHKFHPPCIDPWLINVSGTCPLCRLDLRPQSRQTRDGVVDLDDSLHFAPPLAAAEYWTDHDNDNDSNTNPTSTTRQHHHHHRRRSSLFLDLHRLRHASVEERIEILRRHRTHRQQQRESAPAPAGGGETEEQRGRRARLADRLRERFRIRTRTLGPPSRAEGVDETGTRAGPPARV
ncbi:hypothetical protein N658DRAFT_423635 [Parathielavia hyrcaniae]|uniref:RING-type domain-containing protein n=1 Tax=Parathielavia hyrcaniae TaxID=113614 RepID=A0AAN6Q341_9PEZI|nr:hypothetical protein N658DRAFT_423635 [Parathielavia hyrcaniae]